MPLAPRSRPSAARRLYCSIYAARRNILPAAVVANGVLNPMSGAVDPLQRNCGESND